MAELIRASLLSGYVELVDELGGDPAKLLRALKIPRRAFTDSEQLLDQKAACELLERSAEKFDCPDFGMRLTARQDISAAGPLAVVIRNCATLGDAFTDIARYLIVLGSAPRLTVHQRQQSNDYLMSTELWVQNPTAFPQTMELFVSAMHQIMSVLSRGRAHPKAVFFQHAAISKQAMYRRVFAAPVTFSHPFAGLVISSSNWVHRIAGGNSQVHQIARAYLDLQSKFQANLTSQVSRLASTLLATGKCKRAEVADLLNVHPRTLIRRLSEEGVTFEAIVERERASFAQRLLRQQDLPLGQIAALLGYSEQSSFTRSYRRWFDESPSSTRRRQRAVAGHN